MSKAKTVFSELARQLGDSDFFLGNSITLADILLAPHLELFRVTPAWLRLTENTPNLCAWLDRMNRARAYRQRLREITGDLDKNGEDIASKYTFGVGNTGVSRETYCAASFIMGELLSTGRPLPERARIPEDKMVATVRAAIENR